MSIKLNICLLFKCQVGDHIPTIPPAIARALEWAATAKPWVDPWLVKQEELKAERKARRLEIEEERERSKAALASNEESK